MSGWRHFQHIPGTVPVFVRQVCLPTPHFHVDSGDMMPGSAQIKWGCRHGLKLDDSRCLQPLRTPQVTQRRSHRQPQPCAVASKSGPQSQQSRRRTEPSSTELAAASTSVYEPAVSSSTDEAPARVSGSASASLLASIDDAYHGVTASVHDAEVAVETAWQQSLPYKLWQQYTAALETNPVRTKAMTSFVGFVIGDIMAQKIGGEAPPRDSPCCPMVPFSQAHTVSMAAADHNALQWSAVICAPLVLLHACLGVSACMFAWPERRRCHHLPDLQCQCTLSLAFPCACS